MKTFKFILFSVILLNFASSYSQVDRRIGKELYEKNPKSKDKKSLSESINTFFKKEFELDGFQEAVINNLAKEFEEKYNQTLKNNSLSDFQKREELEKLNENFENKVLEILTDKQKEHYLKKLKKNKN